MGPLNFLPSRLQFCYCSLMTYIFKLENTNNKIAK